MPLLCMLLYLFTNFGVAHLIAFRSNELGQTTVYVFIYAYIYFVRRAHNFCIASIRYARTQHWTILLLRWTRECTAHHTRIDSKATMSWLNVLRFIYWCIESHACFCISASNLESPRSDRWNELGLKCALNSLLILLFIFRSFSFSYFN